MSRCWGKIQFLAAAGSAGSRRGFPAVIPQPRVSGKPPVPWPAKTGQRIRTINPAVQSPPNASAPGQEQPPIGRKICSSSAEVAHSRATASPVVPPAPGLRQGEHRTSSSAGPPWAPPRPASVLICPRQRPLLQGPQGPASGGRPVHSESIACTAPTSQHRGGAQREWPRKARAEKGVGRELEITKPPGRVAWPQGQQHRSPPATPWPQARGRCTHGIDQQTSLARGCSTNVCFNRAGDLPGCTSGALA